MSTTIHAERLGFGPGMTFDDFARMNDAELSGMMTDHAPFDAETVVTVGPPDKNGKRLVVATCGELQHRDRFDCDNAFCRGQFRHRSIERLRLRDRAALHEQMETAILGQANAGADDGKPRPTFRVKGAA